MPVTALSSDGHRTLAEGRLARVNNAVDQASGTIRLKATFDNKDNALWPGLSVTTRLLMDNQTGPIRGGGRAMQHGPNGLYVYSSDANKAGCQRQRRTDGWRPGGRGGGLVAG